MRKAFVQGILLLMVTILLMGCQDGGYTEEPVNDSEEVRAAMNDAALKLYSWRYIGKDLAGSFYLRQGGGPEKKYICTIEGDGKKLMLYAPSDSEFQVDDPTMWFEKVEESDETTSESAINASAKMIMNIGTCPPPCNT